MPNDNEAFTEKPSISSSQDIYEVPRWDDMTVTQKFPYLSFNGYEYSTADKVIPEDKVGKKITSATLTGTDRYTGKGVGIAILDTGISPVEDFTMPRNRILVFRDFIHGGKHPYDDNGHGTHVTCKILCLLLVQISHIDF